jgi:Sulfotransferase family
MTLPNFLVIGAAKCGTDALCKFLGQHPDIYMCPNREPNFFVAEGQPESPYHGPGDRAAFEALDMWVSTIDRYERLFSGVTRESAIGEGTAWYLYFEEAARRIKRYIGHAKLIAILRNPVDRAYSAYTTLLGDGRETIWDFSQAVAAQSDRMRENWDPLYYYVDMGFYARQLRCYRELFDAAQIKTYIYDDFNTRPVEVVQDMFRFLGVDERFVPDTSTRHNVSMVPRNQLVHHFVAGDYPLKKALKKVLPVGLRRSVKHTVLAPNLTRPSPLRAEVRQELVEVFRADILDLQDMIGRDLSAWLH